VSDDYAFFEYRAKITNAAHAEDAGEPVHCFIKMKSSDAEGKRQRNVDLEQQAGDIILFVLNPGPYRKISYSAFGSLAKKSSKKEGLRWSGTEWETARYCAIGTEFCPGLWRGEMASSTFCSAFYNGYHEYVRTRR
jgi:hypothetical protein